MQKPYRLNNRNILLYDEIYSLDEDSMTVQEFIKKFNDFLFGQCGITHTLFDHVRLNKKEPIKTLFFKPYQSKTEFFYKTSGVITAPICASIIAIELAVGSLYLGLKSLVDLAQLDTQTAKIHIIDAVVHLVCSFVALIAAMASPVINFVDLVGSGINTLRQNNETPLETTPSFN